MISLILATKGFRKNEIRRFLDSLRQTPKNLFEVIVVCQDPKGYLDDLQSYYTINLEITYSSPGLSKSRNIGLKKAKGNIIGFPDDDCVYLPNLISNIHEFYRIHKNIDCLSFDVYNLTNEYKLSFVSLSSPKFLKPEEIMKGVSSISFFHRKQKNIFFDENFGIGAKYNSSEELDYSLRLLLEDNNVYYTDQFRVLHPDSSGYLTSEITKRTKSNGIGHGAYLKKHKKNLKPTHIIRNLFLGPLIRLILHLVSLKPNRAFLSLQLILARLKGYKQYRHDD